jgi:actin-binding protein anillin
MQYLQGSKLSTPVHQVYRQPDESMDEEDTTEQMVVAIHVKIRLMEEQVKKQQTVISQASQALNLCRATIEFSNSAEQVEAERLLLLASKLKNIFFMSKVKIFVNLSSSQEASFVQ